jgi:hypothetical protein
VSPRDGDDVAERSAIGEMDLRVSGRSEVRF